MDVTKLTLLLRMSLRGSESIYCYKTVTYFCLWEHSISIKEIVGQGERKEKNDGKNYHQRKR